MNNLNLNNQDNIYALKYSYNEKSEEKERIRPYYTHFL